MFDNDNEQADKYACSFCLYNNVKPLDINFLLMYNNKRGTVV